MEERGRSLPFPSGKQRENTLIPALLPLREKGCYAAAFSTPISTDVIEIVE